MITVVINNSYIRNGCRQGRVIWFVGNALSDPLGTVVLLPDYNGPITAQYKEWDDEDGTHMVSTPLQVVHGWEEGVYVPRGFGGRYDAHSRGLNKQSLDTILEQCKTHCERDLPKPEDFPSGAVADMLNLAAAEDAASTNVELKS